ncbi:MAG: hypothetical protein Q9201_001837 [Fulgogasparrea decipioides]
MDYSANHNRVTVEYTDPSGIYPVISGDLQKQLPLRSLYWNSATRPLRSIASLHIDLVKAGTRDTPPGASGDHDSAARNSVAQSIEHHGPSQDSSRPGSGVGAKKERRHQIPGLRQTPYLKIFFLRCSDVETYRGNYRKQIREWIRDISPPSQSTTSINAQEFHDAFEWLVVQVVLPDDGRSVSRASNLNKSSVQNSSRGSSAVTEKVRADFNGSSRTAVDRVALVQITRDSEDVSIASKNHDFSIGWDDFITKTKSLVLSSFDLRVTQYEDDIKERDLQRHIPGWNFNTFFVLKEGLARGFESVGLVEDALTGYQELALGLNSIIENDGNDEEHRDHFKDYTDDLSMELKRALSSEQSQYQYNPRYNASVPVTQNGQGQADRVPLGYDILDTDRKPFRELILANEISIFDFQCYLFAREVSLRLRLANVSMQTGIEADSVDITSKVAPLESQNLLLLAEVCRRAVEFLATAGGMIRDDLRCSIHPLSKGQATANPSSLSTFEGPIEDVVASWIYSASQRILDVTNLSVLTIQLQPLLRNLKPPEGTFSGPESSARTLSREKLPRRTSSLPVRSATSPRTANPDQFPAVTALDATRLLPPTSLQTGTQELAAQHANLVMLKRRILTSVGHRWSALGFNRVGLIGSSILNPHDTVEISLDDPVSNIHTIKDEQQPSNQGSTNRVPNQELNRALVSEDAFSIAFEVVITTIHNV